MTNRLHPGTTPPQRSDRLAHRAGPGRWTALALAAVLAGCAGLADEAGPALRIEPVLRIGGGTSHSAAAGHVALARQYAGEGRWALAAEQYRRAAAIDPSNADHLNGLGRAEAMQEHHAAAVASFGRAVALAPDRIDLLNNLGYALLLQGQPAQAARIFGEALGREPTYVQARFNLRLAELQVAELRRQERQAVAPESTVADAIAPSSAVAAAPVMTVITAPTVPALQVAVPRTDGSVGLQASPLPAPEVALRPADAARVTPAQEAAPTAWPAGARLQVANGNGVPGAAARLGQWLGQRGLGKPSLANLPPYTTAVTTVQYRAGFEPQARAIAHALPMSSMLDGSARGLRTDVRIVVGHDVVQQVALNGR